MNMTEMVERQELKARVNDLELRLSVIQELAEEIYASDNEYAMDIASFIIEIIDTKKVFDNKEVKEYLGFEEDDPWKYRS